MTSVFGGGWGLVALAGTSRTVLNRGGKSGYPWLVPNLRESSAFHRGLIFAMTLFTFFLNHVDTTSF